MVMEVVVLPEAADGVGMGAANGVGMEVVLLPEAADGVGMEVVVLPEAANGVGMEAVQVVVVAAVAVDRQGKQLRSWLVNTTMHLPIQYCTNWTENT